MQEVFEKIIEKLEKEKSKVPVNRLLDDIIKDKPKELGQLMAYSNSVKIVKQVVEEYNNGWIPVEERLPDEEDSVFAKYKGTDIWSDTMFEKNSKEVQVIVSDSYGNCVTKVAHTVDGKWKCDLLRINNNYKITHWQPLAEPYQPKGEKE